MEVLNIDALTYDATLFKTATKKVGTSIVAKKDLYITFPSKYIDKKLAIMESTSKVLGVFTIDDGKKYCKSLIPGILTITPNEITNVIINDVLYTRLYIMEGESVIDTTTIVKDQDLVYKIFEYFMLQGKVPWFIKYEELLTLLLRFDYYTGSKVANDPLVFEILTAINGRSPKNLNIEFRNYIKDINQAHNEIPAWAGLKNIYYSFKSTTGKIVGSYFKQGVIAAIVNPEKEPIKLEKILRT